MDLLIIRHAIATERIDWNGRGKPDATRPLTEDGIKKFKSQLENLKKFVPKIDLIISSELLRASQTAKLLAEFYQMEFFQDKFLNHGTKTEEVFGRLEGYRANVLCIMGHEPDLSLLTQMILKIPAAQVELKKGGALYIEDVFKSPILKWKITPKILRA